MPTDSFCYVSFFVNDNNRNIFQPSSYLVLTVIISPGAHEQGRTVRKGSVPVAKIPEILTPLQRQ